MSFSLLLPHSQLARWNIFSGSTTLPSNSEQFVQYLRVHTLPDLLIFLNQLPSILGENPKVCGKDPGVLTGTKSRLLDWFGCPEFLMVSFSNFCRFAPFNPERPLGKD